VIPWEAAFSVFKGVTIPKFWKATRQAFPGIENLSANCQGALLSLVFNRGPSLNGDRRRHMSQIRDFVAQQNLPAIAQAIINMIPLWAGKSIAKGMDRRRRAEAKLVIQ
jgi:GH24 family phage-related lysozyme (muramidase)